MSKIPPWATTQSLKGLLDTKCGDGNGKVKAVYFVKNLDDAADFTPGKLKWLELQFGTYYTTLQSKYM